MKVLTSKNGPTVVSSKEFQFFDRLSHEKGIYEYELNENELYTAQQLRQRGVVLRVNDNGKAKYKVFPQKHQ
jgi:hypothetical protein